MQYDNDDELLYLMRCGYQEAMDLLYEKYYRLTKNWIYPIVTSHSQLEYDDCLQIAMMNVPYALEYYRSDQNMSLKSFMRNVLVKRLLSTMRKPMKDKRIWSSLDNWIDESQRLRYDEIIADPKEYYHPQTCLLVKETATYYNREIVKITSTNERKIMSYINQGYSEKEVASILNISIKSVYNAVYRYHKKISSIDDLK